tara:strand:- start:279 stop:470 length:192 start_codon:yes stop_codon:yes gene_type:complete
MTDMITSRLWVIDFYREQLKRYEIIGIGNETEFGSIVTKKMIKATEKRLSQLTLSYKPMQRKS